MRRALLFILVALIASCSQRKAEDVTDAEIKELKDGFLRGCSDARLERGRTPSQAKNFCDCAMTQMDSNLLHRDWQIAVAVDTAKQFHERAGKFVEQCKTLPNT